MKKLMSLTLTALTLTCATIAIAQADEAASPAPATPVSAPAAPSVQDPEISTDSRPASIQEVEANTDGCVYAYRWRCDVYGRCRYRYVYICM